MARTKNNKELALKKQRQICKGAMSVFRTKGFHATSIREIAKASRMSLGSLYYYIEKKEDILFLVHKEVLSQIYSRLEESVKSHDDPATQLVHALRELFDLTCELKDEMLFIYTETKSLKKKYLREILEREAEFVKAIESLIRRGVEEGKFVCRHPDIYANILAFTGTIVPLRGWNILPNHSEEEVFNELVDLFLRGLGSQAPREQLTEKKADT
jgi:AcrR family transcriptional regulator